MAVDERVVSLQVALENSLRRFLAGSAEAGRMITLGDCVEAYAPAYSAEEVRAVIEGLARGSEAEIIAGPREGSTEPYETIRVQWVKPEDRPKREVKGGPPPVPAALAGRGVKTRR